MSAELCPRVGGHEVLGTDCYLTKPVDVEQFVTVVQAVDDVWLGLVRLPRSSA